MPYKDPAKRAAHVRQRTSANRASFFSNKSCTDCGSTTDLQLDHVDASTKVDHRIFSWSEQRRNAELTKCTVRCQPCHVRKTVANWEHSHGTGRPGAKLTDSIVREIRSSDEPSRTLALRYGVHQRIIQRVRKRDLWKHVI